MNVDSELKSNYQIDDYILTGWNNFYLRIRQIKKIEKIHIDGKSIFRCYDIASLNIRKGSINYITEFNGMLFLVSEREILNTFPDIENISPEILYELSKFPIRFRNA